MKRKHSKVLNNNNKKYIKFLILIILLVFNLIMCISGIKIYKWLKENKVSNDIIENMQSYISLEKENDDKEKYIVNFNELKQVNSDTIAWITVKGTDINYPVVKTINNDYYLTYSFDNSYNSAGWVFMNYKNKFDGNDKNIVVFAHNRQDGSMFGTLKNIFTEEWQKNKENYTISFITEKDNTKYQVFSIYKIINEDYYITTDFKNNNEFKKFIDTVESRSIIDFGIDVKVEDKILTLSTCADNNKYRVVLHAKKINE